ncbi:MULTISPECIES: Stk1 family PASTA domain-containing Ser/Thr kinase [unclassified Enterococcus]|uniref:Stk1 family PASTA domain-containing Ser/Thr kinase n=1 Tax=unclassified Enterococcus TaxID=2608891 RepID=UPI001555822C|nr:MULTISPECIES: Stk1 family PASTA domain-containing Ser/Thr kinase [unclassified Enterococcus]MBS7576861.1 Stk1 family PASTA domain-containing Ser/Thr kinase [Enterococcus sp. MMGLQ5-2]MBS7584268.1 Stk1 family PASTA domain-containing Ser/Thr kinase [Enterococcus sp. MMGLQ5-1]NPD12124.1 Stk1 family PASTA domain-containing Ser/Thr kinase [Enterococcus sp. MMGLQ5-1]NPD36696.1 Stk1 family PASTA domain-containing Ser/Thr kinase [Enterococcus sp. MMGLQ5-2]
MIEIGKIFNERYRIISPIGSGGMANVFLAEDLILHRQVAIKVLRTDFQNDPIAIRRFQREAHAATELVHPNIVSVYEVGEVDGMQYLAMEYVKGSDLKHYIRENAPLSNQEAVRLIREILAAITVAHDHKIVHRDLKPQNVLLDENCTAKITDFGIATAFSETGLTQTNSMLGSVHYLSPEQARGASATYRSDIYSIGIILFEMLTNQVPFDGDSAVSIALQHFQEEIPSVREINPNVPQALENVVIRATAKEIDNRYSTTEAMREDLATVLNPSRANESKLTFAKDREATKTMSKLVLNEATASNLVNSMSESSQPENPATKAKKKSKKWSKKKKILLILGILAALVGLILFAILTTPKDVTVPDVTNQTQADAEDTLKESNLKVGKIIEESSDSVDSGKVTRTNPKADSVVKEGRSINLYVSSGNTTIEISDYTGGEFSDAKNELMQTYGLKASQIKEKKQSSDEYPSGTVISQSPAAGTKKGNKFNPETDTITLTVSTGPKDFVIDNYIGTDATAAKNALINAGLAESKIHIVYQQVTSGTAGAVIAQDPAAGQKVNFESGSVTLTVAQISEIDLSSLIGMTEANALSYAEEKGVLVNVTRDYSDSVKEGNVISVDKTSARAGETITIVISQGTKPSSSSSSSNSSSSSSSNSSSEEPTGSQ